MKNLLVIWNGLLTAAVIALIFLQINGKPAESNTSTAPEKKAAVKPIVLSGNKKNSPILFVNSDSLLKKYDYFKKMKSQLEAKGQKAENEMATKMRALETEYTTTQQKAQQGLLSADQMQAAEQSLMRKQQEMQEFRSRTAEKLAEEEAELSENLNKAIREYCAGFAAKNGVQFVLGYSAQGGILFANDSLDITPQVLEGLNAEYNSKKK